MQYLTFNALASSPSGTLKPHSSRSSSQQLPTPSSTSPNASRAAYSYVSVPRGSRRTVVRYEEPVHPRAPFASHSEQKPRPSISFAWGPSDTHHRPLTAENGNIAAFQRDQYKFCSRQGSVSANASPTSPSGESFSGFDDDEEEDDDDDDDDDDATMVIDPTPTASSFNLSSSSANGNPKDMVFQSYLPLPSQSSVSAPASAISPVSSSLLPPPTQSISDLNAQLAPFANAGPAGIHHWTTSSISPQSQSRTHYPHHQYGQQYPPQQHYNSRPSTNNNNTSSGASPLAVPTWNDRAQQQWSPTAPYGTVPPMGVWSETPSPVGRGRRM